MPYVQRDLQGKVIGRFALPQPGIAEEYLLDDHEDLLEGAVFLKTTFTSLEFLDRFTESEQLAVVTASMASPALKLWYDRLLAASFVDLEDPRTEAGIDALIAAELLNAERKTALMATEELLP